jgi:hypothetical protein
MVSFTLQRTVPIRYEINGGHRPSRRYPIPWTPGWFICRIFNDIRLYSMKWFKWLVNNKLQMKRYWPNFRQYPFARSDWWNNGKPQSRQTAFKTRFDAGTSWINFRTIVTCFLTGKQRRLRNEDLHILYSSRTIIRASLCVWFIQNDVSTWAM